MSKHDIKEDIESFEKYLTGARQHLKYVNQQEERIKEAKSLILNGILHARRQILILERSLKKLE